MKRSLIERFKDAFADLAGKNRFERPDFVLLKTMMMLAAMDVERASIAALSAKVKSVREKMLAERYPQGAKFDCPGQAGK